MPPVRPGATDSAAPPHSIGFPYRPPSARGCTLVAVAARRAVVLSDVCLYRDVLASSLLTEPGVAGAVSVGSVTEALATVAGDASVLVLVDMSAPQSHDAVRTLLAALPGVQIVGFAVPDTEDDIVACAELGIAGFVPRNATLKELGEMVSCIVRDELRCTPRVAATLFHRLALLASWRRDVDAPHLTGREREIIALIDGGLSNKEISLRLSIEVATVKNHVHRILEKLHVRRRGEAAARVREAWRIPARP